MDRPESAAPQVRRRPARAASYLTTAAHELRNPLHTLSGYVDMLLDELPGPLTPVQREFLGYVRTSAERLHTLMEDVLLLARADAGELTLNPRRLDVGRLIAECLATVRSRDGAQTGDTGDIPVPAGLRLTADRQRLHMALVRFVETCQVLRGTPSLPRLTVTHSDADLTLSASLPGTPLCPDDVAVIFQRFAQVRVGPEGREVDLGLGLAVCDAIVSLHGGRTIASIEAPDTLVLSITLPL